MRALPPERYEILGPIATGGMAQIFLARERTETGRAREVVLKRLLPTLDGDREFIEMFQDEARLASQLAHPGIVEVHDVGLLSGTLCTVMSLVRGVNLSDLAGRMRADRRVMPPELGAFIGCQVADALDYAHRFVDRDGRPMNVVHRDVSPQNILVTYDGEVKVVDFGVARAEGRIHRTRPGLVKGKFAYMAPEQLRAEAVDGRADIFSLAEVIYELLLRRHPFYRESDIAVLKALLDSDPVHPHSLDETFPGPLADILMRSLRRRREERHPSAFDFKRDLARFLANGRHYGMSTALGRFVRSLFDDKLGLELRARERADDELLIEAMRVGRVEREQRFSSVFSAYAVGFDAETNLRQAPGPDSTTIDAGELPTMLSTAQFHATQGYQEPRALSMTASLFIRDTLPPPPTDDLTPELESPTAIARASSKVDRFGFIVFALGMVTLLAAVIYVLVHPVTSTTLMIESTPPGARIYLDGFDTGATTPRLIKSLRSDKVYEVELELGGNRSGAVTVSPASGSDDKPRLIRHDFNRGESAPTTTP